jgi:pyruvate dehydrogenase E1 component
MNENYRHPAIPKGAEDGIIKGMYRLAAGKDKKDAPKVQLLGSGTILNEVIAAQALLEKDFGVSADVWSCPSFTELRREGLDVSRWNLLHPEQKPREAYVSQCLNRAPGPVVAATDYMKTFADQIRPFIFKQYIVLGTDGFGRSDTREKLRSFFEVDRYYVTVAALKALADEGTIPASTVTKAIKKYGIDPERPNPATV